MSFDRIQEEVARYYDEKLKLHGATCRGVDWNSPESQELRFEQLLKNWDLTTAFSINDYGCGYSAIVSYMIDRDYIFRYQGFDISEEMIAKARELYGDRDDCEFFTDNSLLTIADYTVASGIFNVKLQASDEEWNEYLLHTLGRMAELSEKGFAFNALTKYSDNDHMRPDLYYADPLYLFDYCKRNLSKFVSLLHDYPLYEFTLLVNKD